MSSQNEATAQEKLTAVVEGIRDALKEAHEELKRREQRLGSEVADQPRKDHSAMIASVHEARAVVKAINELWQLGAGLRSGMLLPRTKNDA
jgi:hypothetical protein